MLLLGIVCCANISTELLVQVRHAGALEELRYKRKESDQRKQFREETDGEQTLKERPFVGSHAFSPGFKCFPPATCQYHKEIRS